MNDLEIKVFALSVAKTSNSGDVLRDAQKIYNWLSPQLVAQKASEGQKIQSGAVLGYGNPFVG